MPQLTLPDGFVIDEETGEIIGFEAPGAPFQVTDIASAEWVLSKLQDCDVETLALETKLRTISKQVHSMMADVARRRKWFEFQYGTDLEKFTREALANSKTRSLKTAFGTLCLRTVPPRILVREGQETAAIEWCRKFAPSAVKVKEHILVSELKDKAHLLPVSFEIVPVRDTFRIDIGIASQEGK